MKPDVIFKLEQGEEPWVGDGEVPSADCSGGCENQPEIQSQLVTGFMTSLKCAFETSFHNLWPRGGVSEHLM